jgi:hypothetical protein
MPLLFTSLFTSGAGAAPPEPPFIWTTGLLFRFSASAEVYADTDGTTPADAGDPVARWGNLGSPADAVQNTAARRPIFRTGGLAGRPYLECVHASQQHFGDLPFAQPFGTTAINPYTVFAVTDAVIPDDFPSILGSTVTNGGKVGLYFRPPAGEQIHFIKPSARVGNVANPQMIMVAIGRNAAGLTTSAYARVWIRQNRVGLFEVDADAVTFNPSTAVSATQFLRSSAISTGGFFDGHLYEFLLYNGVLDNATTFAIEDWLMARYGLG